jgi:hypothetical protein
MVPVPNLVIPDYTALPAVEQAQHRANFQMRFSIIQNDWPHMGIVSPSNDMSLEQIHGMYEMYVRHILISQDTDSYKIYMVLGWLLIEAGCAYVGLNIKGYTLMQMQCMNRYERLLVELGESKYLAVGGSAGYQSTWPVELRILFISLVNAVVFIVLKLLSNYLGANDQQIKSLMDTATSYMAGTQPSIHTDPSTNLTALPSEVSAVPAAGGGIIDMIQGFFNGGDGINRLATMGSALINGTGSNRQVPQSTPSAAAVPVAVPVMGATTPRFRAAYDE